MRRIRESGGHHRTTCGCAFFALAQQAPNEDRFDIVVAGAGHNSMVAAKAYLAKAGYRCLLLEGRPIVGGGRKDSVELTLKGFQGRRVSLRRIRFAPRQSRIR